MIARKQLNVRDVRWSPELNRLVLVDCDGNEIDVAFGHDEPPFIPTYEWSKNHG